MTRKNIPGGRNNSKSPRSKNMLAMFKEYQEFCVIHAEGG